MESCATEEQIKSWQNEEVFVQPPKKITLDDIQADLQKIYKGSYGVGGISMYEVYFRFVVPQFFQIKPLTRPAYPFSATRKQVQDLARKIMKTKLQWFQSFSLVNDVKFVPEQINLVWPHPFLPLLYVAEEHEAFAMHKFINKPPLKHVPEIFKAKYDEEEAHLKQYLEDLYRFEVDQLVVNVISSKQLQNDTVFSQTIFEHFELLRADSVPTCLKNTKSFVSCDMFDRVYTQTRREDIQRYVFGLQKVLNLKFIFANNYSAQEMKALLTQLEGQLTVELAYNVNQLLERCYLEPLMLATQNEDILESYNPQKVNLDNKIEAFVKTLTEEQLATSDKAAKYLYNIRNLKNKILEVPVQVKVPKEPEYVKFKTVVKTYMENKQQKQEQFKVVDTKYYQKEIDYYESGSKITPAHWSQMSGEDIYKSLLEEKSKQLQFKYKTPNKIQYMKCQEEFNEKPDVSEEFHVRAVAPVLFLAAKILGFKAAEEKYYLFLTIK